ncbi:cytochrome b [Desulfopila sp. IMCC35006]|uniref:cytochrome b n=1 Tax=Desulfopila sp. IMCC35006 TaxID=2569542 RepID=UPI0010AD8896|nr:cytochrome b [Desulfopila sp. IMCC35006]TKB26195.1 cytochrome b [Desulfopila sp. IMCC35006]
MFTNTEESFGIIARLFHWLVFLMVVGMLIVGSLLDSLPDGAVKSLFIGLHKSTGVVLLLLVLLRLCWRLINPKPRDLGASPFENKLGHLMHIFLYLLLIVQPITGIIMSQLAGYPVKVYGMFTVPAFFGPNPQLSKVFSETHSVVATVLAISIVIHAAAALKHHYLDRDRTLMRMIVGK